MDDTSSGNKIEKEYQDLVKELQELDKETIQIDGGVLIASQCYRFETDPVHMMYNTNCPDSLKQRIESILIRYLPNYERRVSE